MGSEYLAGWMFLALTFLLMAGFPVTFTLIGTAMCFGWIGGGWGYFELLPMRIWGAINNVVLIAVPLFVFMGVTLENPAWLRSCSKPWDWCFTASGAGWPSVRWWWALCSEHPPGLSEPPW